MRRAVRRLFCAVLVLCLSFAFLSAEAEDLTVLQKRLLALGYEIGTADGVLGSKTSAAILLAQTLLADAGFDITPTGSPDEETAALVLREENERLLRTLLKGSWGSRVREAQRKLIGLNLLQDSADGKYGADARPGEGQH